MNHYSAYLCFRHSTLLIRSRTPWEMAEMRWERLMRPIAARITALRGRRCVLELVRVRSSGKPEMLSPGTWTLGVPAEGGTAFTHWPGRRGGQPSGSTSWGWDRALWPGGAGL